MTPLPSALHMHGLLSHRGGAARVARLLAQGLARRGVVVRSTCEVPDSAAGENGGRGGHGAGEGRSVPNMPDMPNTPDMPVVPDGAPPDIVPPDVVPPDGLGGCLSPGTVLHLHATQDWPACLRSVVHAGRERGRIPLVVTAHDCSLLTGGCVNPLDCDGWRSGCHQPCPRGYPDAAQVQRERADALLQAAPVLASPSGWLARMLRVRFPGLACVVVPNGVEDWRGPAASAARATLGLSPRARVVVFVAHGGEQAMLKGGHRWPELWAGIKHAVPAAVGLMVGGDTMARQGDLLRWPYVERAMLDVLLAASDVFVYPTLADNHPLAVLEAMSAGLPVCSFRVGGVPEQVADGVTGLLAEPGDWAGLAASVAGLLARPRQCRELGRAGREAWQARFGAERMVEGYAGVYARL